MQADKARLNDDLFSTLAEYQRMDTSERKWLVSNLGSVPNSSVRKRLDFTTPELTVQRNPDLGVSAFLGSIQPCQDDQASELPEFKAPSVGTCVRDAAIQPEKHDSKASISGQLDDAIASTKLPDEQTGVGNYRTTGMKISKKRVVALLKDSNRN